MNEKFNVSISKDELLLILASLVKSYASQGVKDERLADLLASLSVQSMQFVSDEDIENFKNFKF